MRAQPLVVSGHRRREIRSIRFGVMCPGRRLATWQAECIRRVLSVSGVKLSLLIIDPEAEEGDARRTERNFFSRLKNPALLYNLSMRLLCPPLPEVDVSAVCQNVPRIQCRALLKGKFFQYFSQSDLHRIRSYKLDFILRFAYNILHGDVLTVARYGIWSYHHGDLDRYRGMPAGFWEIYNGDPISGVTLQRLTQRLDAGVVLQRAYYRTVQKSYVRNRNALLLNGASLVEKVCRDLSIGAADYLEAAPSSTEAPIYTKPTNSEMVRFLLRVVKNRISDTVGWLFRHEQWNVGVVKADLRKFLKGVDLSDVQWYPLGPRNVFVADPFLRVDASGVTVLAERFDYLVERGCIVALRFADGKWSIEAQKVFEQPHHLSYPFLFEEEGRVYAIPEQSDAGEVAIYELEEFPKAWRRRATLLSGVSAIDATLFRHGGRYWLFYAVGRNEGVELNIAHSRALLGPYEPHPCNPVKCDVRSTRPAGTPFEYEGIVYRPAQDCSKTYGGAVVLTRVDVLTPLRFHEEVVQRVEPDAHGPFPRGLHTMNGVGEFTVVDGKRNLFVLTLFLRQLKHELQKPFGRRFAEVPRPVVDCHGSVEAQQ
jgi:hypothetical protein